MAFLDPKERILDVVLTDYGRELLARNSLNYSYYAFSDEGIDYSGSLNILSFSSSIDDLVFRNVSFEETQRKNTDLNSFLYTVPAKSKKIPFISTNFNSSSLWTFMRYSHQQDFSLVNTNLTFNTKPLDVVFQASVPGIDRSVDYVKYQNYIKILSGTF